MLRCAELGLSDEALSNMTIGMVFDMICEKTNDNEKYPIKGRGLAGFLTGETKGY